MLYMKLLLQWNEKMNLTAITKEEDIITKHFVDSISILHGISIEDNAAVIDVGTGAGFPGIPIKIMRPTIQLTLLDSLQKRITFLEEVVDQLKLTDVTCVHARAEDGGKDSQYREKFDYCVSRAVARLSVLAEYTLPFVRVGGKLICLKGPEAELELKEAQTALQLLGVGQGDEQERDFGENCIIKPVEIPFSDLHHHMIVITKLSQTPIQYPRKSGKIGKKPL